LNYISLACEKTAFELTFFQENKYASSGVSESHFGDLISKKDDNKMRRDMEEGGKNAGSDGLDTT